MSEASKSARSAMKGKIARLLRTDPKMKVDASGYTPPDALDADVKTGARPVRGRRYKRGGKVLNVEGEHAKKHAGRKPRKSGGSAYATPDNLLNRDMVEANKERAGSKHVGAFKKGGKVKHKAMGGPMMMAEPTALDVTQRSFTPNRKSGGKVHKGKGGSLAIEDQELGNRPSLRLLSKHVGPKGHTAKIYKDRDSGEHRVKYFKPDGSYLPEGDSYHDSNHSDAMDTAKFEIDRGFKKGGKVMKHDDEAEDKKLIKKLIKPTAIKHGMAHKSSGGSNLGPHPEFDKLSDAGIKETHSYWHARKSQADSDNVKHPEAERNLSLLQEEKKKRGMKHGGEIHAASCRCAKCMGGRMAHGGYPKHRKHRMDGGADLPADVNEAMPPPEGTVPAPTGPDPSSAGKIKAMRDQQAAERASKKTKKRGGSVSDGELEGTRPTGGRLARKSGGKASKVNKGPTIIHIDVGSKHPDQMGPQGGMPPRPLGQPVMMPPPGMMPPGMVPPGGAPPMPQGGPQGGPLPMMPPVSPNGPAGGMPPRPPMPLQGPMGRKEGGRVSMYAPKQHGAGGGLGRLQKLKAYGHNAL